ncbi:alpha-amylase family protein [Gaetbulibacter aestuarii]|uniref:Glycosidase n=1 Tax=Gaetbulibacter aestuarii TaxID=1502358 RepID=A0ABW7N0C9_9FLAO
MAKTVHSKLSNGVMLNAYPDSIGSKLSDTVAMLELPEFKDTFSLFYILPTFFNSDLDRGFSIIDYDINKELVSEDDLKRMNALGVLLKFDIVLNHLSVASPQFKDLLKFGNDSKYKDFFINWNNFWDGYGEKNEDGIMIPEPQYLNRLFMRKSGLPILKVPFPDGSEQPYWNTFYQEITYHHITINDLKKVEGLTLDAAGLICKEVNSAIDSKQNITELDLGEFNIHKAQILQIVKQKRSYLGQMDVNAKSPLVWDFYEETLAKLAAYGCKILRLDAFAYLHKEVGQSNFFNVPGTWDYLERIRQIAEKHQLTLLPEIHAEYGVHLHDEVAQEGYQIYDFFLPGLMIHTLESKSGTALKHWANEIVTKDFRTVNMLGCHDGIPVLDLKGKSVNGVYHNGLLEDKDIEAIMDIVMERGGRVKNLYDPSGKKISYYQVNATFFSALGEDPKKLLAARAIQLFMPGIPQVWYLDIFAGKNNYEAADRGSSGGHKEINRTTLSLEDVKKGLKQEVVTQQLEIIRLRNTLNAFNGNVEIPSTSDDQLVFDWTNGADKATLDLNLNDFSFKISFTEKGETKVLNY